MSNINFVARVPTNIDFFLFFLKYRVTNGFFCFRVSVALACPASRRLALQIEGCILAPCSIINRKVLTGGGGQKWESISVHTGKVVFQGDACLELNPVAWFEREKIVTVEPNAHGLGYLLLYSETTLRRIFTLRLLAQWGHRLTSYIFPKSSKIGCRCTARSSLFFANHASSLQWRPTARNIRAQPKVLARVSLVGNH